MAAFVSTMSTFVSTMSTMFNLVPAHFEIGSEKSSKTGQSQGEFLTL